MRLSGHPEPWGNLGNLSYRNCKGTLMSLVYTVPELDLRNKELILAIRTFLEK